MDAHEDIMLEILLRLPVKCLLKCLSVCKGWYGLIKSPRFVDLHLKNRKGIDHLIFRRRIGRTPSLSYCSLDRNSGALLPMPAPPNFPAFPFRNDSLHLCGPCNGIFCVATYDWYACGREAPIFLCNPATRESRRIPNRPLGHPIFLSHLYGTSACGLGFDPSTNDYKVVSVLRYDYDDRIDSCLYRIGIYSLSSDSWREVETALPAVMQITQGSEKCFKSWNGSGLLANGHLHWDVCRIILCFDVADEVMRQIPLPENAYPEDMKTRASDLVVLDDCLAWAVAAMPGRFDDVTCFISIWTMKDYGAKEPWMKRFSVCIPFTGRFIYPMSIWNDDTLLLIHSSGCDELISVKLGKEGDDCPVTTQKLEDRTSEAIIMLKESLVPLR